MKKAFSSRAMQRALSAYLMAAILFSGFPISIFASGFSVNLTANGQKEITISPTETFNISLSTVEATACEMVSPISSGISLSTSMDIEPGHPWYPDEGTSTVFSVICYDAEDNTLTDSAIVSVSAPSVPEVPAPIADIKVNDSDGPVTITDGDSYIYSWTSNDATACELTSPENVSGISLSGSGAPIEPGHPWYPTVQNEVTLSIECSNTGENTASDSVIVRLKAKDTPPPPPPPAAPTADIKVNGSNGPVTITEGDSYVYTWTSANATACELTSPSGTSGIALSGTGPSIVPAHPWYPSLTEDVTLTLTCTNAGPHTATDSVVVKLKAKDVPPPAPKKATLNVTSSGASSVSIARVSGPSNIGGTTNYTRTYETTISSAVLRAPATSGSNNFNGWTGCDSVGGAGNRDCTVSVALDQTKTVTVNYKKPGGGGPGPAPAPTADIKANGSDGPVTIIDGDSYIYSWTSANATACTLTSPSGTSGIELSGTGAPIEPSHPWYPKISEDVTLTLVCTNATATATDSVVVKLKQKDTPEPPKKAVLNVNSSGASSVAIARVSGPDNIGGTTNYTRSYDIAISDAVLEAPATSGTRNFENWTGCDSVSGPGNRHCAIAVELGETKTITANYKSPGGGGPGPSDISVSLVANPSTINRGQSSILTWSSTNANECQADWTSATTTSGTQSVSPQNTTTYEINCFNNTQTASTTATVTVNTPGGGGGGGGSSRPPTTTEPAVCFYLRDYLRIDFNNDPIEVLKLQTFLVVFEGHTNLSLTGVFDKATYEAVSTFQMKYFTDILEPWGHTGPTGYVYYLTQKKVNEIYCQRIFPLSVAQEQEIIAFRALLESLRARGYDVPSLPKVPTQQPTVPEVPGTSTPTELIPIVGEGSEESESQRQNLDYLASVLFARPQTTDETVNCACKFLLILVVLYIIGSALKNVLYKDIPENVRRRFLVQWLTMIIGIVLMIMLAFIIDWWCLILPLIIALILAIVWTILFSPNQGFSRASAKSWYLVLAARIKSMSRRKKNGQVSVGIPEENKVIILGESKDRRN